MMTDFFKELSSAYNQAQTEEDYNRVVLRGKEIRKILVDIGKSFNEIALFILPAYWAEYYLLLKFPKPTTIMDRHYFAVGVRVAVLQISTPNIKVAYLYLESVSWDMVSAVMYDFERAQACKDHMKKIISEGSVSIVSILQHINTIMIKNMADKNWQEVIIISKEIEQFSEEVLKQPGNLRHTANIYSNQGASRIRGDIDIADGRESLLKAKSYYLLEEIPSETHLEGIKNRLREADEKS